jgi:hypothetical protein
MADIIAAAVALDDALSREQFPQARHEARVLALRANKGGFLEIAASAHAVMMVLDQAIRPERVGWEPVVAQLHAAIDHALDDGSSSPPND